MLLHVSIRSVYTLGGDTYHAYIVASYGAASLVKCCVGLMLVEKGRYLHAKPCLYMLAENTVIVLLYHDGRVCLCIRLEIYYHTIAASRASSARYRLGS